MRRLIRYSFVTAISVVAVLAGSLPAYAESGGTIDSGGGSVNERSGPGTSYSMVGSIADGAAVDVDCVGTGTSESGPFGSTTMWDEIGNGRWVTDAFVDTRTDNPIAMPCATSPLGHGAGQITTNVVAGCDETGMGGGTNHGSEATGYDWYAETQEDCPNVYEYTFGNGPTNSNRDFATWAYYPGAGAPCQVSVHIPTRWITTQLPYDSVAQYVVGTDYGLVTVGSYTINQQTHAGDTINIGTYYADGSGYLQVQLGDADGSAGSSQVVVANSVTFNCTSDY